jgi:hypothetical protein
MQVKDTITLQTKKDCKNSLTLSMHSFSQTLVVNLPPRKFQNSQEKASFNKSTSKFQLKTLKESANFRPHQE